MLIFDLLGWSLRHFKRQFLESFLIVTVIALGIGLLVAVLSAGWYLDLQYPLLQNSPEYRTVRIISSGVDRGEERPLMLIGDETKWETIISYHREQTQNVFGKGINLSKLEAFQNNLPSFLHVFTQEYYRGSVSCFSSGTQTQFLDDITIASVTPSFFAFQDLAVKKGILFLQEDMENDNKVAVLSDTMAITLFGDADPLGAIVWLNITAWPDASPIPYTVIGVLEADQGATKPNLTAYVPSTGFSSGLFSEISVGVDIGFNFSEAVQIIEGESRLFWGDHVFIEENLSELQERQENSRFLTLFIGIFASIGLVVAAINILNLMIIRVMNRIRFMGLSMALGASKSLVFGQFVVEALTLGMLGAGFGTVISVGFLALLDLADVSLFALQITIGISIGIGISLLFGVYPAYLTCKIDPADALRLN